MRISPCKQLLIIILFSATLVCVFTKQTMADVGANETVQLVKPKSAKVALRWKDNDIYWQFSPELDSSVIHDLITTELTININEYTGTSGFLYEKDLIIHSKNRRTGEILATNDSFERRGLRQIIGHNTKIGLTTLDSLTQICTQGGSNSGEKTYETEITFGISLNVKMSNAQFNVKNIDYGAIHSFPLRLTCYDFIYDGENTPAKVTSLREYNCDDDNPVTPPLLVQGTGYSHVVMESNSDRRKCVPEGSATTEDRDKVVWKSEDGGNWKPND